MSNTSLLIRVQARGGKFLGPDINYSYVEVTDANSGLVLACGPAGQAPESDSGVLSQDLNNTLAGPSTGVVLTYGTDPTQPPQVWYLGVNPKTTASFTASFDLEKPTLLTLIATRLNAQGQVMPQFTASATMWMEPGMQLTADPGYIITMPGLAVTVQNATVNGNAVDVTAKVTMMCGCPIDDAATVPNNTPIPWPACEFVVTAELWDGTELLASAPLALQATSVFGGAVPLPPNAPPADALTVVVRAVQASTANTGSDSYPLG
ncbi:MAG: hypothetical protein ACKN9T_18655 [Candidatus Methylumidiphilus sp.]